VVWANLKYVTCQIFELFFLSFFFAFFATRSGHISWPLMIYAPKRVFPAKHVPFGGLDNIRLHLGVKPQKNLSKTRIGILQPNRQSRKIAISVINEDICVKFHRQLEYRGHYRKNAKLQHLGP